MTIEIIGLSIISIFIIYFFAKKVNKIFRIIYILRSYFSPKLQKFFYTYEKYSLLILIGTKKYLKTNNFIFQINEKRELNKLVLNINKNIKKIILIFFSRKSSYFNYVINSKKYNKKILINDSINLFSINPENKRKIEINLNKNDYLINNFFIKKNEKKRLVLFFLVDGLSNKITSSMKFTKNYFGSNNKLENMWANAPWTLPSFSNLISGKYTSNHLNYKHFSNYKTFFNIKSEKSRCRINAKETIFETFKNSGFVTGCYSPYQRINPTYDFDRGVDILRYCERQSSDELIDNIIAQIEMFKDTSNFIFAHSFDTHGAVKDFHRIGDFAYDENLNKNYKFFDENNKKETTKDLEKISKKQSNFVKNKTLSERNNLMASFKYNDLRLNHLYNYIDKLKLDDYTIVVFGDHGTRFAEINKTQRLLSNSQVNVGLFIKDKKVKSFKKIKNKPIQTIDFFPSLIDRYSLKTKIKKNNIDGINSIYSKKKNPYILSESVYEPEYHLKIIYKNIFLYSVYDFKNFTIMKHKYRIFHDYKEKTYNIDEKIKNKIITIEKKHIIKNKLNKIK